MNLPVRIAILFGCLMPCSLVAADAEEEINTALDYYAEVWNEGDFEMLRGYYHPSFVLVSNRGIEPLAQRLDDIRTLLQSGDDRGDLSYSEVRIRSLGDDHALAWGGIRLEFKDGSAIDNWFSTVYQKTPFGWKAILTHQ